MTTQQNDGEVPGMTVGELRQALETLDPRLVVIVRFVVEEPARILCPHGSPLVHAFGGPAPDVQRVLREAQEALR